MSTDIRIKKGLDIKLIGEADKTTTDIPIGNLFAIRPENFHGVTPKLLIKEKSHVKSGEALFYNKTNQDILFPSPVSGEITEIVRGEKRKILEIKITADNTQKYQDFDIKNANELSDDAVKAHLLASGCWPFIKQRPYHIIANPNNSPKEIFISAYDSAPLAPDLDYTLKGKEAELQEALFALAKLTDGKVHVSIHTNASLSPFANLKGIVLHKVSGPHPSGNVGTQIAKINPINKGDIVWTISPQDLVIIGELFLTGKFNAKRMIALTGAQFQQPSYITAIPGAQIKDIVSNNLDATNTRIISGNVLTGKKVTENDYLGYYDNHITAIPEGNDYELFGWALPTAAKVSPTRALTFSWLFPKKKFNLNTNTNGEHRAFVMTGMYEKVFPLDIYPMQILKACMYKDLDEMEALGMYEVAPEDFALTEFVCISKQPHQQIIREGLDLMIKEIG